MRPDLIVTVADANFVNQAKQLFSSIHFKGGWQGDYMLLSFGVPAAATAWFQDRGILVRECTPIFSPQEWAARLPADALEGTSKYTVATMGKFYLLLPEFRRWSTVVYLDSDIIVRASLRGLARARRFSAVPDYGKTLLDQFVDVRYAAHLESELDQLSAHASLATKTFNAGVFAFPTDVVQDGAFDTIVAIARKYIGVARYGDQLAWNLLFHRQWDPLSYAYNYFVYYLTDMGATARPDRLYGAVLHFPGLDQRPWDETNLFYPEWKENLARAGGMDVRQPAKPAWRRAISHAAALRWAALRDRIWEKTL
jgi:lipopolysaccharide biosynthesis glycosyltransferase